MFRKKVGVLYPFLFFISLVFLAGCFNNYEYQTDDVLVTASVTPAGPDDYRNLIGRYITIYDDGTLTLSEDEEVENDEPVLEDKLSNTEIEQLKEKIEEKEFRHLKKDVTSPSEDGARYHIAVNFKNGEKQAKGWNPDDENFNALHEYIFDLLDEDLYAQWRTEIEEYIWENHTLITNEKDEYKEDGPFFTLEMESWQPDDEGLFRNIPVGLSLDLDRNLHFYVDQNNKNYLPKIEKRISEEELAEFQEVILENFWKINENQRDSDKKHMEMMTVYLTEEEKTIEGQTPDHPRYVKIKDKIISFIDDEEYEKWENKVEKQLLPNE